MLLKLILILGSAFLQTDDIKVEVGDRFTVRTTGSNEHGAPEVRTIAVAPNGSEVAVATERELMFIRPSDGEVTHRRKETPFSIVYSADSSRVFSLGERESRILRVADKAELPTSFNRPKGYVGLHLGEKNGKIIVTKTDPGSPAEASGKLKAGTEVVGFADGLSHEFESVVGHAPSSVYEQLEGTAGNELRLNVIPRGKIDEEEVTLTRMMVSSSGGRQSFTEFKPAQTKDTTLWCMSRNFHELRSTVDGSYISSFSFRDFPAREGTPSVSPDGSLFAWVSPYKDAHNAKVRFASKESSSDEGDLPVIGLRTDALGYSRGEEYYFGVEIRKVHSKELVATFPVGVDPVSNSGQVFSGVHLDEANGWLVVATQTCLQIYDIENGNRIRIVKPVKDSRIGIYSSAIAGRIAAVGDWKGIVRIVDLKTGELLQTLRSRETEEVTHIEFANNGSVLSYHVDGVIHVVNLVVK